MFHAKIVQRGIVFHDYGIYRDDRVLFNFRADQKEAQAIIHILNLVDLCAKKTSDPFPFAIVQQDQSSVLCGPKDSHFHWGPILVGPNDMLEKLLPHLMRTFHESQIQYSHQVGKI